MSAADGPARVAIGETLQARWAEGPETVALASEDGDLAFADMLDDVDRMMGLLVREGWTPDAVVGLAIRDPRLHLAAAMAALCLGGVHVALPGHETDAANRSTAATLGVSLLLCDAPRAWADGLRAVLVDRATAAAAPRGLGHASDAAPGAAAIYIKTSGSTAVPKVFPMSFRLLAGAAARCLAEPMERRVMRTSSVEFDSSRIYRLYAMLAGRASVLAPRDMADLGPLCARLEVSQIHIGTYALASLVRSGRTVSRMPDATSILTGGSRVPGALRAEIAERLSRNLWISYATSEIGQISLARPEEHEVFPEGVGLPRPDAEVEIVDEEDRPVPRGEVGEVRARRPAAPTAYVGRDGAAQFRDGWFYPKDLMAWPADGPLIYHGRADDVMLLNGVKISGEAIEDALAAVPGVREAVAFSVRSRLHGEIPAAAVVLSDDAGDVDAAALLAACRRTLGLRGPRRVVVVEAIPRTHTGKPLKRELSRL